MALYRFGDLPVMPNFHTFPFLQRIFTSLRWSVPWTLHSHRSLLFSFSFLLLSWDYKKHRKKHGERPAEDGDPNR